MMLLEAPSLASYNLWRSSDGGGGLCKCGRAQGLEGGQFVTKGDCWDRTENIWLCLQEQQEAYNEI